METEIHEVETSVALTAVDRASIDSQIATAKSYPRSVTRSLNEAVTLATMDEETAASMFYAVPRKENGRQKMIEGPSARLAEVMTYAWGNCRGDGEILGDDGTHVTSAGIFFDLERNVAVRVRVKRRITNKDGKRYSDDMIGVTGNAALSIALRNAVFKVIPRVFIDRVYRAAREAAIGKGGTIAQKRQRALDTFGKLGLKPEQVFSILGVRGLDDVGEDELIQLRGLHTAIKDGEVTVESLLNPVTAESAASDLNARFAKPTTGNGKAKPAPAETPMAALKHDLRSKTEQSTIDAIDGVMEPIPEADIPDAALQ